MTTLVTGGGRGIGRAIALAFAERGATVAIAARTFSQLEETAAAIRARGARAIVLTMDVTDGASVTHGFTKFADETPRIDVLVNNAGVGGGEPVQDSDESTW